MEEALRQAGKACLQSRAPKEQLLGGLERTVRSIQAISEHYVNVLVGPNYEN